MFQVIEEFIFRLKRTFCTREKHKVQRQKNINKHNLKLKLDRSALKFAFLIFLLPLKEARSLCVTLRVTLPKPITSPSNAHQLMQTTEKDHFAHPN